MKVKGKISDVNWITGKIDQIRDVDSVVGLVTQDESERRLFLVQVSVNIIFITIASILFNIWISTLVQADRKTLNLKNYVKLSPYPKMPQLTLLLRNGSFWKLNANTQATDLLIQLPATMHYYYFSFARNGVVHFVRNDLKKDIIRYNMDLNTNGHDVIPNTKLITRPQILGHISNVNDHANLNHFSPFERYYEEAVFVNDKLWVMDDFVKSDVNNIHEYHPDLHTFLWYGKRSIWRSGPQLTDMHPTRVFCSVVIDLDKVVLLGGISIYGFKWNYVTQFDFQKKQWNILPHFEQDNLDHFESCSAAVGFNKNGTKYIILQLQACNFQILQSINKSRFLLPFLSVKYIFDGEYLDQSLTHRLLKYDFEIETWTQLDSYSGKNILPFHVVRHLGSILLVFEKNDEKVVASDLKNGILQMESNRTSGKVLSVLSYIPR